MADESKPSPKPENTQSDQNVAFIALGDGGAMIRFAVFPHAPLFTTERNHSG